MRESLFERLKKEKISYILEFEKIYTLIKSDMMTKSFYELSFKNSPYRVFSPDLSHFMYDIFENIKSIYSTFGNGLNYLIEYTKRMESNLTLDSFLDYLELFKTLDKCGSEHYRTLNVNQISQMVDSAASRLGYSLLFSDETGIYKAALVHPLAESVMVETKHEIGEKIAKYLTLRNGDVENKRLCLKDLADDIELICKKYKGIQEYKKLSQFIQCVRHTKDKPVKEFPFFYKNEEKWLDKIFEMVIGILSFTKTKDIVCEIIDNENKTNSDKCEK